MAEANRCDWARGELETLYHDTEWGVPEHNDDKLFEFLILEGMQAGLTWSLILKRREAMRAAFDGFDARKIARYNAEKKAALLQDASIIRNRAKIDALVGNAQAFLQVQKSHGSFNAYIWQFAGGKPIQNKWERMEQMPAQTPESDAMSKALRSLGFRFVGSTICYSFMQAAGMVNDHLLSCDFHARCANLA